MARLLKEELVPFPESRLYCLKFCDWGFPSPMSCPREAFLNMYNILSTYWGLTGSMGKSNTLKVCLTSVGLCQWTSRVTCPLGTQIQEATDNSCYIHIANRVTIYHTPRYVLWDNRRMGQQGHDFALKVEFPGALTRWPVSKDLSGEGRGGPIVYLRQGWGTCVQGRGLKGEMPGLSDKWRERERERDQMNIYVCL